MKIVCFLLKLVLKIQMCIRDSSYAVVDGDIYFRENSIMRKADLSATATGRIKGMVELRTIVPVSYTHLDVYKRQPVRTVTTIPYIIRTSWKLTAARSTTRKSA